MTKYRILAPGGGKKSLLSLLSERLIAPFIPHSIYHYKTVLAHDIHCIQDWTWDTKLPAENDGDLTPPSSSKN